VEKFKEWTSSGHQLPEEAISRDDILTDVSIYWFTQTAGSAANVTYYEACTPATGLPHHRCPPG
jgi:hypothetical protein